MKYYDILVCPKCGESLDTDGKSLRCKNGHCYDISKEGYVNLILSSGKNGDMIGDSAEMAKSRRAFLEKDYFSALSDKIAELIASYTDNCPDVVDICCGEGYYSQKVLERKKCRLYGFDLSKTMVKLAAKRRLDATFFAANLSHIPIKDASVDAAFHLFAPFHEKEFSRILKDDGVLLTAVPGKEHLYSLKEAVYDKPYYNDEKLPEVKLLTLCNTIKASKEIELNSNDDILSLFNMTPYSRRTSENDKRKLAKLNRLTAKTEFVIGVYKKCK